ncbi:purine/pyrimidine permease [Clostridium sp. JNZ J1-5]|nr:purine/pyrimidine permease [Clostridium sp.]
MDKQYKTVSKFRLIFLSLQWTIFILAGSVVAPLAVGAAFHLPQIETSSLMQRSFFVMGLGTLIQVFLGHKLQIPEGAAGLWWGVFLIFAGLSSTLKLDAYDTLRSLEFGLIIGGIMFAVMGTFGIINKIRKLFTPIVTGTYLVLLIAQLSGAFVKGILGIGYLKPHLDIKVAFLSIITIIFTGLLSQSKNSNLKSFSILYGMIFGWILFAMFGLTKHISYKSIPLFALPKPLVWGNPKFNVSITIVSIIVSLLLISNLIASVEVVKKVMNDKEETNYNRLGFLMGINHIIAGIFSTIGFVPVSSSPAFIETTGIREKKPFIIGSIFILVMGFFPVIAMFFASIPVPVGYATIFIAFAGMIGLALKEYTSVGLSSDNLFIISLSLFIGIGSMFIPKEALEELPSYLVSILNNGLIMGVLTCIIIEQVLRKKHKNI